MSPLDPEVPPAGEEIHLPGGSIQPVLLTFGITVALVGVTTNIFLVIAGAILAVARDRRLDPRHAPRHRRASARARTRAPCAAARGQRASGSERRGRVAAERRDVASSRIGSRTDLAQHARAARRPRRPTLPHALAAQRRGDGDDATRPRRTARWPARRRSRRRRSSSARCRASRAGRRPRRRSVTTRWRKPPRTIATAASSSDQSGAAKTMSDVRWSATRSAVGILAEADGVEQVALGEDAGARALGIEHHGGADAAIGHEPRGLAQGVARTHGQDHLAHAVTYLHARSPPPPGASLQRLAQSTSR